MDATAAAYIGAGLACLGMLGAAIGVDQGKAEREGGEGNVVAADVEKPADRGRQRKHE